MTRLPFIGYHFHCLDWMGIHGEALTNRWSIIHVLNVFMWFSKRLVSTMQDNLSRKLVTFQRESNLGFCRNPQRSHGCVFQCEMISVDLCSAMVGKIWKSGVVSKFLIVRQERLGWGKLSDALEQSWISFGTTLDTKKELLGVSLGIPKLILSASWEFSDASKRSCIDFGAI